MRIKRFALALIIAITALWVHPSNVYGYEQEDEITFNVTVQGSSLQTGPYSWQSGQGQYAPLATVEIRAGVRPGWVFAGWSVYGGSVSLANPLNPTTWFTMPRQNVSVTANWWPAPGLGGDNWPSQPWPGDNWWGQPWPGDNWWPNPSPGLGDWWGWPGDNWWGQGQVPDNLGRFNLRVMGSTHINAGDGNFAPGTLVTVRTTSRAGQTFSGWSSYPPISLSNPASLSTSFIMPPSNITLVANWGTQTPGSSPTPIPAPSPTPSPALNQTISSAPSSSNLTPAPRPHSRAIGVSPVGVIPVSPQLNHLDILNQIEDDDAVVFIRLPEQTNTLRLHGQTLDALIEAQEPLTVQKDRIWVQLPPSFVQELRQRAGGLIGQNGGTFNFGVNLNFGTESFIDVDVTFSTSIAGLSTTYFEEFSQPFNFVMDLRDVATYGTPNYWINATRNSVTVHGIFNPQLDLFILPTPYSGNFTVSYHE